MSAFNFHDWLTGKSLAEPRIYKWDRAAKFVSAHIRSTGEQPFASFHGEWLMGDYDRPELHEVGYVVLFNDRFWLVHPIWQDERQCMQFDARKVSRLKILPYEDARNWRMCNFSINDDWLRLSVWPPFEGGREAFAAFKSYL